MGLLDVATVERGDGDWTHGHDQTASNCGIEVRVMGPCSALTSTVRGTVTDSPQIYQVLSFGVDAVLIRKARCSLAEDEQRIRDALLESEEQAIARVFNVGPEAAWTSPYLMHEDVSVLNTAGLTSIDNAVFRTLEFFYRNSTLAPVLHLGVAPAFQLSLSARQALDEMNVKLSVSPGYSNGLVAVTGPVAVQIGSIQSVETFNTSTNMVEVQATYLASVDFDMCSAVRYLLDDTTIAEVPGNAFSADNFQDAVN